MLSDFKSGDKIKHICLCKVQKIGTSSNGGVFARGIIQDNTASLPFICFDSHTVEKFKELTTSKAFVVFATVDVNRYANDGSLQAMLQKIEEPLTSDDLSHLLASGDIDVKAYEKKLEKLIEGLIDQDIKRLLKEILQGNVYQEYKINPAGMSYHHAYIGGLLEHSVDVAELALAMGEQIGKVDKDLILAGALLHDIGKLKEISSDIGFPYTVEGKLVGHIPLGAMMINESATKLSPPIPPERLQQLLHIILSHHGEPEKGSPMVCKTKEAYIVHHADELDSIMNKFRHPEGNGQWQYSKMLSREILVQMFD